MGAFVFYCCYVFTEWVCYIWNQIVKTTSWMCIYIFIVFLPPLLLLSGVSIQLQGPENACGVIFSWRGYLFKIKGSFAEIHSRLRSNSAVIICIFAWNMLPWAFLVSWVHFHHFFFHFELFWWSSRSDVGMLSRWSTPVFSLCAVPSNGLSSISDRD